MASSEKGLREVSEYDATVEAEYGQIVVEGYTTLAHHGPRTGNPAPCVTQVAAPLLHGAVVGLSHFDLDGLGGCMRLAGYKPQTKAEEAFWLLVAELDVRGYHQMKSILNAFQLPADMEEKIKEWYHAFQAWSQKNRYFPPRDGSLTNCTTAIRAGIGAVVSILSDDSTLLSEGAVWLEAQRTLDQESIKKVIITCQGPLLVRQHAQSTNFLYNTHAYGGTGTLVLAHNLTSGVVTLSRESDAIPVDACEVMQSVFGPEAGGRAGIAGSPRGRKYTSREFSNIIFDVVKILNS
jgi:hypothetical protein